MKHEPLSDAAIEQLKIIRNIGCEPADMKFIENTGAELLNHFANMPDVYGVYDNDMIECLSVSLSPLEAHNEADGFPKQLFPRVINLKTGDDLSQKAGEVVTQESEGE